MPNRVIREAILSSEKIDKLSEGAELFYRRLMSVVDDFGRFRANPKLLLSACYPLRVDSMTLERIAGYLSECVSADLVRVYEVDKKAYLELRDFDQRLRTKRSKFPADDGTMTVAGNGSGGHVSDNGRTIDGVTRGRARSEAESENESENEAEAETTDKRLPPAAAFSSSAKNSEKAAAADQTANLPIFLVRLATEFPEFDVTEQFRCARDKLAGDAPGEVYMRRWLEVERQKIPKPAPKFIPDFEPSGWYRYLRRTYPKAEFSKRWEMLPRSTQIEAQQHFIDEYRGDQAQVIAHNGAPQNPNPSST
jgi:hypothetical protein